MGGVNFTRNRAWWHTAIWDEYAQRQQYMVILPTFALLIPYYWHGAFLNRNIEQNFAAKMYQLDYEQKRNRLTHNLIMEHFETHVEKVQDILDEIEGKGFEETFRDEIDNGLFNEFPLEKTGITNRESWSQEKKAEILEYLKHDQNLNYDLNYGGHSIAKRKEILDGFPKRKFPGTPFKFLDFPFTSSKQPVERYVYIPTLNYSEEVMKTIKTKGGEPEAGGDEE